MESQTPSQSEPRVETLSQSELQAVEGGAYAEFNVLGVHFSYNGDSVGGNVHVRWWDGRETWRY